MNKFKRIKTPERADQKKITQKLTNFYWKYILPTNQTPCKINIQLEQIKNCQYFAYMHLGFNKMFFFGVYQSNIQGPFCVKNGINMLSQPAMVQYAPFMFIGYGVCYTAYVFFESRRNLKLQEINLIAMKELSLQTYNHLLHLDSDYHMNASSRQSLYSIYRAQKAIESNLKSINQYFLPLTADIVGTSALLWIYFGWPYMATFGCSFAAYSTFTLQYSNFRRKLITVQKQMEKQADQTISQALSNLYTVKYFNAEKFELSRYDKLLISLKEQSMKLMNTLATLNSIQRLILATGMTVNLLMGVSGVQAGLLSVGDLVLIQSLMIQLFAPLFMLGVMHREWTESTIDIQDLFQILERKPKIVDSPDARDYEFKNGSIRFEKVSFKFEDKRVIFDDFSLNVKGGDWTLITGESGVGKSTLFNLIFRLLDPDKGEIYLDEQNIRSLKMDSFRKYFGVVSQQSYFFNDTIRNNLMYGLDLLYDMSPELIAQKEKDMIHYCSLLGLNEMIENLANKYQSNMGEQANKFSGGEKQRMQIVRCLLRGAKILLLDEPTSALDSQNENHFITTLENVLKTQDLTVFIISHRLHLNRVADNVFFMGQETVEFGKHETLLLQDGEYAKMWEQYQKQ